MMREILERRGQLQAFQSDSCRKQNGCDVKLEGICRRGVSQGGSVSE